jgi:hypothetical protein
MPNGARNMPAIPMNIISAILGIRTIRPPILDITASDPVLDRPRPEEEERLCHGVEDDQEDRRPDEHVTADTRTGGYQAEVR